MEEKNCNNTFSKMHTNDKKSVRRFYNLKKIRRKQRDIRRMAKAEKYFNTYSAEIFCINNGDQRGVSLGNHHKWLSQLFPLHLNTYVNNQRSL